MLKLNNQSGISIRKTAFSAILLGLTFFAFASIGGDKNKSKNNSLQSGFTPVRTSQGFTLKEGLNYRGSMILKQDRDFNYVSYNSLVTYQKGNATYILPNKYKVPLKADDLNRSSLQLLQLKIKLCK